MKITFIIMILTSLIAWMHLPKYGEAAALIAIVVNVILPMIFYAWADSSRKRTFRADMEMQRMHVLTFAAFSIVYVYLVLPLAAYLERIVNTQSLFAAIVTYMVPLAFMMVQYANAKRQPKVYLDGKNYYTY